MEAYEQVIDKVDRAEQQPAGLRRVGDLPHSCGEPASARVMVDILGKR
jgi:hypothetical protein